MSLLEFYAKLKVKAFGRVRGKASFNECMLRRRRVHYAVRDRFGHNQPPIHDIETKLGQKKLAEVAGIKYPKLLQGPFDSTKKFDLAHMPENFVIKPNSGAGGKGVLLLKKQGDVVLDIKSGKSYDACQGITDDLVSVGRSKGHEVFAEEMIFDDGIPCDYKLYCFYGKVGIIAQIVQGSPQKFKYYSANGSCLGRINNSRIIDKSLKPPVMLSQMIDYGERVSSLVKTPFLRVDLYEASGQVYFGEVALRPGGSQLFCKRIDEQLGNMWEDAEMRLMEECLEHYIP